MGLCIFEHVMQICNQTGRPIKFRLSHRPNKNCPLPYLPAGATKTVKQGIILRLCSVCLSSDWRIDVLVDDVFTGVRLKPSDLLKHVRIVFVHETGRNRKRVFCVYGVREKRSDIFYGLRFIGYKRNSKWKKRRVTLLYRSDSEEAENLMRMRSTTLLLLLLLLLLMLITAIFLL